MALVACDGRHCVTWHESLSLGKVHHKVSHDWHDRMMLLVLPLRKYTATVAATTSAVQVAIHWPGGRLDSNCSS